MAQNITTKLEYGMTNDQVKTLQQFLNTNGFPVASAGQPGSAGNETNYFGAATMAALKAFQTAQGIASAGTAGYGKLDDPTMVAIGKIAPSIVVSPTSENTGNDTGNLEEPHISSTEGKSENPKASQLASEKLLAVIKELHPDYSEEQSLSLAQQVAGIAKGSYDIGMSEVPQYGTPAWTKAAEDLESGIYDIANLIAGANTETEKAVADYQWSQLQKDAQKTLGLSLSNNVIQAWDQIQALKDTMGQRGLTGSGIEAEQMDNYLKKIRVADQQQREVSQTGINKAEQSYYASYASPEEIKALIAKDPAKAKAYGLLASAEILKSLDPATLRAQFPKITDEQIQQMRSNYLDENGNVKSTLYKNLASTVSQNLDSQKTAGENALIYKVGQERTEAQLPYDTTQPFSKGNGSTTGTPAPGSSTGATMYTPTPAAPVSTLPETRTTTGPGWAQQGNGVWSGNGRTWYEVATGVGTPAYRVTYSTEKPVEKSSPSPTTSSAQTPTSIQGDKIQASLDKARKEAQRIQGEINKNKGLSSPPNTPTTTGIQSPPPKTQSGATARNYPPTPIPETGPRIYSQEEVDNLPESEKSGGWKILLTYPPKYMKVNS